MERVKENLIRQNKPFLPTTLAGPRCCCCIYQCRVCEPTAVALMKEGQLQGREYIGSASTHPSLSAAATATTEGVFLVCSRTLSQQRQWHANSTLVSERALADVGLFRSSTTPHFAAPTDRPSQNNKKIFSDYWLSVDSKYSTSGFNL